MATQTFLNFIIFQGENVFQVKSIIVHEKHHYDSTSKICNDLNLEIISYLKNP